MVCEKILLLHFKSGKISVIIFLGPLLMELHFLFMNADYSDVSAIYCKSFIIHLQKNSNVICIFQTKNNLISLKKRRLKEVTKFGPFFFSKDERYYHNEMLSLHKNNLPLKQIRTAKRNSFFTTTIYPTST